MSTSWKKVGGRRKERGNRGGEKQRDKRLVPFLSEDQVRDFLSTYKTAPCAVDEFHDQRLCPFFHDKAKDHRRNPYHEYYTEDECTNPVERMYHPSIFRTTLCNHGVSCPFGSSCSHAHSKESMRARPPQGEYEGVPAILSRPQPTFSAFIPKERDFDREVHAIWSSLQIQTKAIFVPLEAHCWFLVQRSDALFRAIQEFACEEGLGTVTKCCRAGQEGILAKGLHVEDIQVRIQSVFSSPSKHFYVEERSYGERVVHSLREYLSEDRERNLSRDNTVIEVLEDRCLIRVAAVNSGEDTAKKSTDHVFDALEFWIDQEGYDKFTLCGCCTEKRNPDQGFSCKNGHFFCSVGEEQGQCFAAAIMAQVNQIRGREHALVCPECQDPYGNQAIAEHLPANVWKQVWKAIVDKNVEKHTAVLEKEFEARLQEKVTELMDKYGNADDFLRAKAQKHALEARNSVLNLSCPHCGIAYFEFSGCMTLKCTACEGNFCGYCHHSSPTAGGTHEHVRQCLMNETPTGSYYATEEVIAKAQKKYRTRELKLFLRRFKKDVQNAIVIELQQDLNDLAIRTEALFEFGNLQA